MVPPVRSLPRAGQAGQAEQPDKNGEAASVEQAAITAGSNGAAPRPAVYAVDLLCQTTITPARCHSPLSCIRRCGNAASADARQRRRARPNRSRCQFRVRSTTMRTRRRTARRWLSKRAIGARIRRANQLRSKQRRVAASYAAQAVPPVTTSVAVGRRNKCGRAGKFTHVTQRSARGVVWAERGRADRAVQLSTTPRELGVDPTSSDHDRGVRGCQLRTKFQLLQESCAIVYVARMFILC